MGDADGGQVPSEQAIAPVLDKLLRTSNLDELTLNKVMAVLADKFECAPDELSQRKKYVRRQIEQFLRENCAGEFASRAANAPKKAKKEEEVDAAAADDEQHDDDDNYEDDEDSDADDGKAKAKKRKRGQSKPKMGVAGKKLSLTSLERAIVLAKPLAEFFGEEVLPRTHVSKRIIAYVKEKDLQDPKDRRTILCDATLESMFKVKTFTFFSLNKLTPALMIKRNDVEDKRLQDLCDQCDERTLAEKQRVYDEKVARGEPVGKQRARPSKRAKRDQGEGKSSARKK